MRADHPHPNVSLSERKRAENAEIIFLDEGRSISGANPRGRRGGLFFRLAAGLYGLG